MSGDPRAGSAAQIAAKVRPRRDHVYDETRHCHHCQQQGHFRQVCPIAKQDRHGADDEEADNARRLSADPLPILHGDRDVHWQGATREVPVHPHQEASQEDKHGEDDEEADNARRLIADPLPIRHGDREVHWQGEVPVHPHQEASQEDELERHSASLKIAKEDVLRLEAIQDSLVAASELLELVNLLDPSGRPVSSAGSSAPHPPAAAASSSGAVVDVSDAATAAFLAFLCGGSLAGNAVLDDFARRPQ